ncbi:MAG TPA: OmpH family outer membrane protein [Candidatus Acidoferrales bacterium]|nr:OmpH family outer membrane protein [Candidatus Acidoferrales bacterium]
MKIRAAFPVTAAVLWMTAAVWGQASTAGAQTAMKVGVINIQAAIAGTAEGKQAAAELQSQFAPRTTDLQNMQKQIQDLGTRLQNGQTTLSDEEKARLQRQYEQSSRMFQRKQQEFQDDTNDAQQEVVNRIGRKMIDVIDKYSKENNYSVILDESSQQTPVIYAANQIDVTQDIIRLYDQSYPVKNPTALSGSAPKPAPKPAPATPAPKPQP